MKIAQQPSKAVVSMSLYGCKPWQRVYECFACERPYNTKEELVKHIVEYHNIPRNSNIFMESQEQQEQQLKKEEDCADVAMGMDIDTETAPAPKKEAGSKLGEGSTGDEDGPDFVASADISDGDEGDSDEYDDDASHYSVGNEADTLAFEKDESSNKTTQTATRQSVKFAPLNGMADTGGIPFTVCVVHAANPMKNIPEYFQEENILFPPGSTLVSSIVKDGYKRAQPIAWIDTITNSDGTYNYTYTPMTPSQLKDYKILASHRLRLNSPYPNTVCSTQGCNDKITWRTAGVFKRKVNAGGTVTAAYLKNVKTCLNCRGMCDGEGV
ncbi:hypothetical protein BGZ95_010999 [Linnemannia exigua]|uniref:C2H2-type domain-containing protein n=1 Tax=Linnemannia exigua TaxID=604196 RepID=A0AAD4DAI0_9FUNG|nr:hypothetical protein BGZ95_010999 [Linnemannia exigua]